MAEKYKKFIITLVALAAIGFAIYGVYSWQKSKTAQPIRQESEIR